MCWLSDGWGRAGGWSSGVGESAAPSPVQLYSCTRSKGRAWGFPATAGTVERKGTGTGAGTRAGGKILVFGAEEQRGAKEQPWYSE